MHKYALALATLLALPLRLHAQAPTLTSEAYGAAAINAVHQSINYSDEDLEDFGLVLAEDPVVKPDCSRLHRKQNEP